MDRIMTIFGSFCGFAGPKVDYNEHPQGDMAVAEKYIKLAGFPSGKYTGSETLQVIGDNHIGDWGTQFGMILFGYKHFLDRGRYKENAE